jgi:hypothetical protein
LKTLNTCHKIWGKKEKLIFPKSSEVLSGTTTIKATPPRTHPHLSRNAAATNTSQFNVYHKISPKPEDGAK